MVTLGDLQRICPTTRSQILARYVNALNDVMREFEINTPEREAMFLAQVCHESGGFNYVREIASGEAYEGRANLGNTQPGDGVRYKGRGLIQITGRKNHEDCGNALGLDLVNNPELLEQPTNAARSAGWFFKKIGGNELSDKGDFKLLTKRINGGFNGMQDRLAYLSRAQEVFS